MSSIIHSAVGLSYPVYSETTATLIQTAPFLGWMLLIIACWASRLFPTLVSVFNYGKLMQDSSEIDKSQNPQTTSETAQNAEATVRSENSQKSREANTESTPSASTADKPAYLLRLLTAPRWYTSHAAGFGLYYKISFLIIFCLLSEVLLNIYSKFQPLPSTILHILPFLPLRAYVTPFHLNTMQHIPFVALQNALSNTIKEIENHSISLHSHYQSTIPPTPRIPTTSTHATNSQKHDLHQENSPENGKQVESVSNHGGLSQLNQFNTHISSYITSSHDAIISFLTKFTQNKAIITPISTTITPSLSIFYSILSLPIYQIDIKYASHFSTLGITEARPDSSTLAQYLNETVVNTHLPLDLVYISTLWSSLAQIAPKYFKSTTYPSLFSTKHDSDAIPPSSPFQLTASASSDGSQHLPTTQWPTFILNTTFLSMGRYVLSITICILLVFFQITRRLYETYFTHVSAPSSAASLSQNTHNGPNLRKNDAKSQNTSKQHIFVTIAGLVYYLLVIATPFTFSYISLYTLPSSIPTIFPLTNFPSFSVEKFTQMTLSRLFSAVVVYATEVAYFALYSISFYFFFTFVKPLELYKDLSIPPYNPALLFSSLPPHNPQHNLAETNLIPSTHSLTITPIGLYCLFYFLILILCVVFFFAYSIIQHNCHSILADLRKTPSNSQTNDAARITGVKPTDLDTTNHTDQKSDQKLVSTISPAVSSGAYSLPTRGWFKYITCPHYLAESMIYCTLAILVPFHPSSFHLARSSFYLYFDSIIAPILNLLPERIDLNPFGHNVGVKLHDYVFLTTFSSFLHIILFFTPMTLCFCWVISNLGIVAENTHRWYHSVFGDAFANQHKTPMFPKSFLSFLNLSFNPLTWR